jgi:spore coat protein U-like protein
MMRTLLVALLLGLFIWIPNDAHAQSCTASASPINFNTISPVRGLAVTGVGTVTVNCSWPLGSLLVNALVCLNLNTSPPLAMANGINQLQYGLFQDSGHSMAWGSVYSGTTPISVTLVESLLTGTASAQVTVYGQIASNQPTVPSVGNSNTLYTQNLAAQTSINYGYYLLAAPTCASLTTSGGTFPFTVSATVVNDCIITATNMTFPSAGVLSSALQTTGAITTQCTNGDAFRIALSSGSSGNVAARQMQRSGGGGAVNYQLYLDPAYGTPWGDGTNGTSMATGTGSGTQQVISVYGQVPPQSTPVPGNYSDMITATISF